MDVLTGVAAKQLAFLFGVGVSGGFAAGCEDLERELDGIGSVAGEEGVMGGGISGRECWGQKRGGRFWVEVGARVDWGCEFCRSLNRMASMIRGVDVGSGGSRKLSAAAEPEAWRRRFGQGGGLFLWGRMELRVREGDSEIYFWGGGEE